MPKNPTKYARNGRCTIRSSSAHAGEKCKTENVAFIILKTARQFDAIRRKEPTWVASAACYIASTLVGAKITIQEISEVAGVPKQTINARYNDLVRHLIFSASL
jgi:transcription initiation factor TFIIIB Brf1 subunit/transcription initiation factor TFIIB